MQQLSKGSFYGNTDRTISVGGLTITETAYVHDYVDWHYHELPYFTYLLHGRLAEANHTASHACVAGDVLFHNWQDAHYNRKPGGAARGFHVEIDGAWLSGYDLSLEKWQGSYLLRDPDLHILMGRLFRASYLHEAELMLGLNSAMISLLVGMDDAAMYAGNKHPAWVARVKSVIHDCYASPLSLSLLATGSGVHPVHLCRDFSRYFGSTPTTYIRKVRVGRSLSLIHQQNISLVSIAYQCGFADQSHFIRSFRSVMGCTPGQYRQRAAVGE